MNVWQNGRTLVRVRTADGTVLKLKRPDLQQARLRPASSADGRLELVLRKKKQQRVFTGTEAERIAGLVMPRVNSAGARPAAVREAVAQLEAAGGPEAYIVSLLGSAPHRSSKRPGEPGSLRLGKLPVPSRLAVEMALHEEQERRALEVELKGLALAWQEAEEVAAIADDLLLPDRIRERIRRARPD